MVGTGNQRDQVNVPVCQRILQAGVSFYMILPRTCMSQYFILVANCGKLKIRRGISFDYLVVNQPFPKMQAHDCHTIPFHLIQTSCIFPVSAASRNASAMRVASIPACVKPAVSPFCSKCKNAANGFCPSSNGRARRGPVRSSK